MIYDMHYIRTMMSYSHVTSLVTSPLDSLGHFSIGSTDKKQPTISFTFSDI